MRCKVKLERLTKLASGGYEVQFLPVTYGEFFKYTPSGEMRLAIVNEAVGSKLEPGREYYVDFSEAL